MLNIVKFVIGTALLVTACNAPAPVPGASRTPGSPSGAGFGVYHDDAAGFSIQYPSAWQRIDRGDYPVEFTLQVPPGTNLLEKRMEIVIRQNAIDCQQSQYAGGPEGGFPRVERINGVDFLLESMSGIATGNVYEWVSYSTMKDTTCITITFVLHSASSGVYATEPAPFDKAADSAIFTELINSFQFDK